MSSADGSRGDDGFYTNSALAGELPSPLAHLSCAQPQAPTVGNAMPPPIMWQPPLLNQQFLHHQSHAPAPHQQQHQQQQQYNELYYNMHAQAYTTSPVQPETYSVLPVGHGNFLKVYHRTEAAPTSGGANDTILYQQQFQQQQQYHLPTGQQTQPIFNSYELFSSNTLMSTSENTNLSQSIVSPELPLQPPQQQPTVQWLSNNNEMHTTSDNSSKTTNMIINQLVNNWSPNLTGGTYSQFTAPLAQVPSSVAVTIPNGSHGNLQLESQFPMQMQSELSTPINLNGHGHGPEAAALPFNVAPIIAQASSVQPSFPEQGSNHQQSQASCPIIQEPQQQPQQQQSSDSSMVPDTEMSALKEPPVATLSASATIASNTLQGPEGNKKRIVAEVKPMRMTYSDVLSKLNNQHSKNQTVQQKPTIKSASERKTKPNTFTPATSPINERKLEHKRSTELNTGIASAQRQYSTEESIHSQTKGSKKSPPRDNREPRDLQNSASNPKLQNNKQRVNPSNCSNFSTGNKHSLKTTSKIASSEANISVSNAAHKKRLSKRADVDFPTNISGRSTNLKSDSTQAAEKDFNGFYNVAAKTTDSGANLAQSTSSSSPSTTAHNNNCRRSGKSNSTISSTASSSGQSTRNAQRSSNGSSSSSYGYSTKRGRGANLVAANNNIRNRNLELAKKCLNTWFEYTMKVLTWLFYLVYDIVVLGFSMVYERVLHYYASGLAYAQQLRKELRQNSNKPSLWIKNCLRRFDARFKKNSRWAFWRRFHKKKQPEIATDFYKNGRLPQTGEEAMFSLLNCKGKDAYSILGVPPNCSQEQIRKHYKKIAVLVHPDKNKQAGAEEAFKVLQRAFELIGEPENRESYDRSLDEALHAEKAWTELHDLLSQLQTKITEAANTIRCSTCGLRHPRKLTDRPHYAARECASCKIRHSAREGDIWAETTLLGLRWKYLALMEGKVYNITEWANCQKGALSHLEPNSHMVQYRIVRGAQHQQQTHQQQHHQQQQPQSTTHQQIHNTHTQGAGKYKRDMPPSEATLHEFLDNLYSGQHPGGHQNPTPFSGSTRKRTRRN